MAGGRAPAAALPVSGAIDEQALSRILDGYEQSLGAATEGNITLEGSLPVPQYPQTGYSIDRTTAGPRIAAALSEHPRPELVVLDVALKHPLLSAAAVDEAYNQTLLLLNGPITLTRNDPDVTVVLSEEQLAGALITRVEAEPQPRLAVSFDPALFDEYLRPARERFVSAPVDARILIDDNDRSPSSRGFPGRSSTPIWSSRRRSMRPSAPTAPPSSRSRTECPRRSPPST